ncbi:MAG: thiolase family protein [Chloroflexi bacterium]|nr:thiolase family protein [Chloroflexota bacterium]
MSIRGRTAIVGYHEVPTLRHYGDRSSESLMAEVARGAIRDAGLRKEDIDGVINGIMDGQGQNSLEISEYLGLQPRYTASMTVHGASGTASIATAAAVINAGLANYVLCIFGESRPQSSSRLSALAQARGGGPPPSLSTEWEAPFGPVIAANGPYGQIKQRHMYKYGTTPEQFAKCAVDERFNALENENAVWKGRPITIEDVLNSRYTNDPLHLLECVMPCSGAGAVIVTSAERARALPNPPVYILGVGGPATRHDSLWQEEDVTISPVVMSAPVALQMSGYSVRDIEFAQFYDCYTILSMMCLEDAGICPKGEIGPFYPSPDTTYKGAFPINTDGGQISAGQPGLAGGFRHVVEATRQIMGRAGVRQVAKNNLCLVNG